MTKKILVIDDEKELVEIVAEKLQLLGYETLRAFDGVEGLQSALLEKPSAIISDINMPGLDGLQMLEALSEKGISIPLIFITGHSDAKKVQQAWKLGAFDFLEKPFKFELLESIVRNAVDFGYSAEPQSLNQDKMISLQIKLAEKQVLQLQESAIKEGLMLNEFIQRKLSK